jgi:parvulin-like peptidyl-prolyl isomerase
MNGLKNRKNVVFTTLLLVLAVLLSSCGLVQVNEDKDRKIIVAKVNGEDILKGDLIDLYKMYYGQADEYDKDIMTGILDSLIEEELVKQKTAAAGHVVNDEIRGQAKEEFEQTIEDHAEKLKEQADEDADPNTDYLQLAKDDMKEYLESANITEEEFIEESAEYIAIQNYLDKLTDDLTVDDKEIEEYYQKELDSQLKYPSMTAYYSSVPIVTEPAMRRVKHILIKLPDEDTKSIQALRQEDKDDEADELREEKLEALQTKAEAVFAEAKSNKDFESLIVKHGEDPGMKEEEYKDGYTMYRDSGMYEEFLTASFELKEGEISELIATDVGYHIIKAYEATEDVIAPLVDVKEEIRTALLNKKKSEKTDELIKEWLEEADIKKYENRL